MIISQLVGLLVVVLAATAFSSAANVYEVMVSTRTLRKSKLPEALNRISELAADGAINMVLETDKKIFVPIHTGDDEYYQGRGTDPWRDEHHRAFLQKLGETVSDRIASDNMIIVPQLYDVHEDEDGRRTSTDRWFGDSESVKSAIAIYTSDAHYTGNTPKRFISTGPDTGNERNVFLSTSSETDTHQQWRLAE